MGSHSATADTIRNLGRAAGCVLGVTEEPRVLRRELPTAGGVTGVWLGVQTLCQP